MEDTVDFRPGFRLSEIDVGVLILGILASILLARFDESFAVILLFTVAHFFLFCNVLRMSRPLELAWAALFVLLAGSTVRTGFPPWSYTFSAMLAVTIILAVVQILRPSYHGVFWRQFNPNLPQWWAANGNNQA
jgi:hypothetical protein